MQSAWPFHRPHCQANEFADAVEAAEPRFGAWLRRHGRQAALGDGEVARLERAGAASSGPLGWRGAVMASMYGRARPGPAPPAYTRAERAAVAAAGEAGRAARAAAEGGAAPAGWWGAVLLPSCAAAARAWAAAAAAAPAQGLGAAVPHLGLAWTQGAGLVEVHVRAPPSPGGGGQGGGGRGGPTTRRPAVALSATTLSICWGGSEGEGEGEAPPLPTISGTLAHPITPADCAWTLCDGVLTVSLAKATKRGGGGGNDGTKKNGDPSFWRALFAGGGPGACALPPGPVPAAYAALADEDDGVPVALPPLPAA